MAKTPRARSHPDTPGPGVGVDASGGPVVDPTVNVLLLVDAANKRQDDLRKCNRKYLNAGVQHVKELAAMRHECGNEVANLRADHAKQMAIAESKRVDAIRQVDQLAVNTAAERSLAAIQTLAATTNTNAENIRATLSTTAGAVASQTAATVQAITERIAALEKSSYERQGKSAYADPMMSELVAKIERLSEARAGTSGRSQGMNASWVILIGAVTLIATVLAIGSRFMSSTPSQPQVVYVPAAPGTLLPAPSAPPTR